MYEFDHSPLVDVDSDGFRELVADRWQSTPVLYTGVLTDSLYDARALTVLPAGDPRNMQTVYRKPDGSLWQANGYQIVSAGRDDKYGRGGVYDSAEHGSQFMSVSRRAEWDNITNFGSLTLGPWKSRRAVVLEWLSVLAVGFVVLFLVVIAVKTIRTDGNDAGTQEPSK